MSDDVLKLIPVVPNYVPEAAAQARAVAALESLLPEGENCTAENHGHVTFIDQGENIEAVICPSCHKRLPFYDAPDAEAVTSWWHEAIDHVEAGSVEGIRVTMPCCSATIVLTALAFDWPAGFAQFELSIWNPGISENLAPAQLAGLESILGCKLLQVRAHY